MKKELLDGVHFVSWQTVEQLAGVDEGVGQVKGGAPPLDQVAGLEASDELAVVRAKELAGAAR